MWTPPLRESFSYPFLVFQLLAVTLTIKYVTQVCKINLDQLYSSFQNYMQHLMTAVLNPTVDQHIIKKSVFK